MQHWIAAKGSIQQRNLSCIICAVYAPNGQNETMEVWDQLRRLNESNQEPMILMGDFNEVVWLEERRGASIVTQGMCELRILIQDMNMIDMEINMRYTWLTKNVARRIDKIMIDMAILEEFPHIQAYSKDRLLSDHHPILLASSRIEWGPIPFRSLDCWLQEPSFLKVFEKEWIELAGLPFDQKLRKLKAPLRKWNREVFGNIELKIQDYKKELDKLDMKAQEMELQESDWCRRNALQSQLWLWMTRKERYWRQMSRCKLIKEGDKNTRYFHTLATIRRRRNTITSIKQGDLVINDQRQIRRIIVQHFKQLYSSQEHTIGDLSALDLTKLTPHQCAMLEEPVSSLGVKEAVLSCDGTKAPGYDGFNLKCIKQVWPIMGEDFS